MPYEFYKIIHICALFLTIACVSAAFIGNVNQKWLKITSGVSSFLILVSGMGLLARLGVSHGEGFPTWVVIKMVLWALIAIGAPVLSKRLKSNRTAAFFALFIVFGLAAVTAITHN